MNEVYKSPAGAEKNTEHEPEARASVGGGNSASSMSTNSDSEMVTTTVDRFDATNYGHNKSQVVRASSKDTTVKSSDLSKVQRRSRKSYLKVQKDSDSINK